MEDTMQSCVISIHGEQMTLDHPDKDQLELVTQGVYSARVRGASFRYEESELTGLEGTTTTFDIDESRVVLTREGTVNTQMIFQEGKKHFFAYETPYGSMMMGIDTQSVDAKLNDAGGDLFIRYSIDMDSSPVSQNLFHINIRKA